MKEIGMKHFNILSEYDDLKLEIKIKIVYVNCQQVGYLYIGSHTVL